MVAAFVYLLILVDPCVHQIHEMWCMPGAGAYIIQNYTYLMDELGLSPKFVELF